jgi:OmpA-OmpF porin, OOP family
MKKLLFLVILILPTLAINAQLIKKIADRAKTRVENNANNKVNNAVDKTVDDAMNPDTYKGDKNKDTSNNPVNKEPTNKSNPTVSKESNSPSNTPASAEFKTFSKYDFVPGAKVIGFEDFSTGNIGDSPVGWNSTASSEIVSVNGMPGRWLWLTARGEFVPPFPQPFPEDFTLEFDLLHGVPINGGQFQVCIAELANMNQPQYWSMSPNQFTIELNNANTGTETGVTRFIGRKNSSTDIQNSAEAANLNDKNNPAHISIWRQKERVRVYVNEKKIWDVPMATIREAKFNSIVFSVIYAEEVVKHFIGNLRFAVGAPDTRKKILEQNKWVTHGILFDINSDKIKPESYGTLKEMANVLKEFADLKVKIVGHTDADGNDVSNLDLSKRRAASVKTALSQEFSIDESRMETDGKGESEPIDKNDSPSGKANNRRVEFIKI